MKSAEEMAEEHRLKKYPEFGYNDLNSKVTRQDFLAGMRAERERIFKILGSLHAKQFFYKITSIWDDYIPRSEPNPLEWRKYLEKTLKEIDGE